MKSVWLGFLLLGLGVYCAAFAVKETGNTGAAFGVATGLFLMLFCQWVRL